MPGKESGIIGPDCSEKRKIGALATSAARTVVASLWPCCESEWRALDWQLSVNLEFFAFRVLIALR
jgi:hypothetical protein